MKYIGIITAMDEEINSIENLMTQTNRKEYYSISFLCGKIHNIDVVVVKSGVGKVNSARVTQILIDKFDLECIINIGVAGGLNYKCNIGDIVIGKSLVQHDFDISVFGHSKGYVPGVGNEINADQTLLEEFKNAVENINNRKFNYYIGTIATGDSFISDVIQKDEINSVFKADACDMECAAIGQICYLSQVPFITVRSISDTPNGNNVCDYNKFLEMACKRVARILDLFLENRYKMSLKEH